MKTQAKLINYVIKKKNWKQTELAKELGVSRAQITKWKNGTDQLPYERENQLARLAGFDENENTKWSLFAPDPAERNAWIALVLEALNYGEDGYATSIGEIFHDTPSLYTSFVLFTLRDKMKIALPSPPTDPVKFLTQKNNYFASILIEFLDNYDKLEQWTDVYLENERILDEIYDFRSDLKIEGALLMAAYWIDNNLYTKAGVSKDNLHSIKHQLKTETVKLIGKLCQSMQQHNIPFEIDYFDFANKHPYELDDTIMFRKIAGLPNSIEAILPYEQQRVISLLEENQSILKEIRDALVKKNNLQSSEN
ncbi:MAG: helix-turn-helix domain-containing protein [Akkermansiaceae bacterium]